MPTVINESHPIARKEHKCSWCGGVIPVGEKYERAFLSYEGYTYEWKNHEACRKVAGSLDMFDECGDEGLDEEYFRECIDNYIWTHHQNENDEIDEGWDLPTYYEKVLKILEEKPLKLRNSYDVQREKNTTGLNR